MPLGDFTPNIRQRTRGNLSYRRQRYEIEKGLDDISRHLTTFPPENS